MEELKQIVVNNLNKPFKDNKKGVERLLDLAYEYGHASGEVKYYLNDLISLLNSFSEK